MSEHKWDRSGERCEKCGDKDWMGGSCSVPANPTAPDDPHPDQKRASANVARNDSEVDHACSTGDCGHDKQADCDSTLARDYPREWWISDERPSPPKVFVERPDWAWPASKMLVHVIEHSAYAALEKENAELRAELEALKSRLNTEED